MSKYLILITISFTIVNCFSVAKDLKGVWVVDEVRNKGEVIPVDELFSINILVFKEYEICELPPLIGQEIYPSLQTQWKMPETKEQNLIIFESRNKIFHDTMSIDLIKQEGLKPNLILTSEEWRIMLSRF